MTVEERSRPTICDGRVLTFATSFAERPGAFGPIHDAQGPFEVSASRARVYVHRAELESDADVDAFREALSRAQAAAQDLARIDRGSYRLRSAQIVPSEPK